MINVKFLEDFVKTSQTYSKEPEYYLGHISPINFYSEFRTYGLNLPRQSGKTTALDAFAQKRSCLRFDGVRASFVSNFAVEPYFQRADPINANNFRAIRCNGLKYQCIVADEFYSSRMTLAARDYFWQTVFDLHTSKILTDDFFILHVGTAR